MKPTVIPSLRPIYQRVVAEVCQAYQVTEEMLVGKSRVRRIVIARRAALVLLRNHSAGTLQEVADCFGVEHSAVCHAASHLKALISVDGQESCRWECLKNAMKKPQPHAPSSARAALIAVADELEAKVRQLRATIEEMKEAA